MRLWIYFMVCGALLSNVHASVINTGNHAGTNTNSVPLNSKTVATPRSMIRLEVGGAKFSPSAGEISVTITVDTTTPSVTSGPSPDQSFRDDATSASYFGYYLTLGTRSSGQTMANIAVSATRGASATLGRTFGVIGNGTTTPTQEGDLLVVPDTPGVFALVQSNAIRCGPSYVTNGLTGTALNCASGSTTAELDATQFVKVEYADPPGVPIRSIIEFIAEAQ